jgi:hypothetical protein
VSFITFATLHILRQTLAELENVSAFCYTYGISRERRSEMNLDEYKAHVLATRKANAEKAMSVLSATISNNKEKEGGN